MTDGQKIEVLGQAIVTIQDVLIQLIALTVGVEAGEKIGSPISEETKQSMLLDVLAYAASAAQVAHGVSEN